MTDISELKIPQHIAIIMDGNGRWAKKRHKPRTFGHTQGARTLEQILEDCDDLGVKYLTVYAFSTENWSRPFQEVQVIMKLFKDYLINSIEKCMQNNVRCMIIGEREHLNPELLECINRMEEATKDNTYRLGGNSCLSGDFMGSWHFPHELHIGDEVIFEDMIHYTTVKTNMFNGISHPSIGMMHTNGEFELFKQYKYEDYRDRMD